jgi:Membrane transporters of cations and cationic drugs
MAWIYLGLAAIFEVGFAISMKASKGFTVFWPSVGTVVGVVCGVACLTLSLRSLPVSIAYPIWVGAGALGTVIFGVIFWRGTEQPQDLERRAYRLRRSWPQDRRIVADFTAMSMLMNSIGLPANFDCRSRYALVADRPVTSWKKDYNHGL